MHSLKISIAVVLAAALVAASAASSWAQAWPAGPIRIVVGDALAEIVERIAAACAGALADPTVRERLAGAALEAVGGTPDDVSRRLAVQGEAWLRWARELGLERN